MAFDIPPAIAPLVIPVVGLLRTAQRHFDDGFSFRVGVCQAPGLASPLTSNIKATDFDPMWADTGHTKMALARYAREQDVTGQPLVDAVKAWAALIAHTTNRTVTVVVDCCSQEGATGWLAFGQHTFHRNPSSDGESHRVPNGFLDKALHVALALGTPQTGPEWALRDRLYTNPNAEPVFVHAATVEDAFALLGAVHVPELWSDASSGRWDLAQNHKVPDLMGCLKRFG